MSDLAQQMAQARTEMRVGFAMSNTKATALITGIIDFEPPRRPLLWSRYTLGAQEARPLPAEAPWLNRRHRASGPRRS